MRVFKLVLVDEVWEKLRPALQQSHLCKVLLGVSSELLLHVLPELNELRALDIYLAITTPTGLLNTTLYLSVPLAT